MLAPEDESGIIIMRCKGMPKGFDQATTFALNARRRMEEYDLIEETVSILKEIPGGREVIEWFDGWPSSGMAKSSRIRLVRKGPSYFRIAALASEAGKRKGPPSTNTLCSISLCEIWSTCVFDGFAHQNVNRPAEFAPCPRSGGSFPVYRESVLFAAKSK